MRNVDNPNCCRLQQETASAVYLFMYLCCYFSFYISMWVPKQGVRSSGLLELELSAMGCTAWVLVIELLWKSNMYFYHELSPVCLLLMDISRVGRLLIVLLLL